MTARSVNNKYGAKKLIIDGETFDSRMEARRWRELRLLQRAGEIDGLQRQVKYVLIPEQLGHLSHWRLHRIFSPSCCLQMMK